MNHILPIFCMDAGSLMTVLMGRDSGSGINENQAGRGFVAGFIDRPVPKYKNRCVFRALKKGLTEKVIHISTTCIHGLSTAIHS